MSHDLVAHKCSKWMLCDCCLLRYGHRVWFWSKDAFLDSIGAHPPIIVILARIRRRSAAARLLRSWVRIPPGTWMFVFCECCVLSGRGLCDELITRPEESYQLWSVVVCDLETSRMRRPWPALGRSATAKKKIVYVSIILALITHREDIHTYICNHLNIFGIFPEVWYFPQVS